MKPSFILYVSAIIVACGHNVIAQLIELNQWTLSEDAILTFPEMASKYGHPAEEWDVITEDEYILTTYRIPGDKTRPVLLIHGNTPTGDCWIMRGEISLAITLAKQGYDVWVANMRGSTYSRRHVYLNPDKQPERFFNYTFYEQGIYDIPATVDLILNETGQSDLTAIGHSVGTTVLYVMGAEKPEYNDKIRIAISLAPISFLDNLRGLGALLPSLGPVLIGIGELFNLHEIAGQDQVGPLLRAFCLGPVGYILCIRAFVMAGVGYSEGFEEDFMPNFFAHYPGGTSLKLLKHLVQVIEQNDFVKFDYGENNLAVYNSSTPPPFDLSKVTMKSALFVGKEDYLATVLDSERLNSSLPNVVHYQVMPKDIFSHIDFIWDRYMNDNLYPYLLPVIEKYT